MTSLADRIAAGDDTAITEFINRGYPSIATRQAIAARLRHVTVERDEAQRDACRGWFWADLYHDTKSPNQIQYNRDFAMHAARQDGAT